MKDKIAVITGGSRGIGRSIALHLDAEGCHVSICGRTQSDLEATTQELQTYVVLVHSSVADVTKPDELEGFVEETASSFSELISSSQMLVEQLAADFWNQDLKIGLLHLTLTFSTVFVPFMHGNLLPALSMVLRKRRRSIWLAH